MNNCEQLLAKCQKTFHIPIVLYENNLLKRNFDQKNPYPEMGLKLVQSVELPDVQPTAFICYTGFGLYCAMLHLEKSNHFILLGPVADHPPASSLLLEGLTTILDDASKAMPFINWFRDIPLFSKDQFLNIIDLLSFIIGEEGAEIASFSTPDTSPDLGPLIFEHGVVHEITHQTEHTILSYITHGKTKELSEFWNQFNHINIRPLTAAANPNQAFQEIFLTSCSLASRAAIQGGADFNVATSMADHFTVQYKSLTQADTILRFITRMFTAFADLAGKAQEVPASTPTVKAISHYITSHIYEKILTRDIARHLDLSIEYLCRHFKQHTGLTISYYINYQKIRESKLLLETTNMSLADIGAILGFSSQAYFQTIFKQHVGMTPQKYRDK